MRAGLFPPLRAAVHIDAIRDDLAALVERLRGSHEPFERKLADDYRAVVAECDEQLRRSR